MTVRKRAMPTGTRGVAVSLLRADHRKVDELFKFFEALKDTGRKKEKGELAREICRELRLHTGAEDEVFYPAVRKAIKDDALMDEADVEHASAKQLIEDIEAMQPGDDHYDAKVIVLGEYIRHHVKEEHTEMFPKARKSGVDLQELGLQIKEYKLLHGESRIADRMVAEALAAMPLMV